MQVSNSGPRTAPLPRSWGSYISSPQGSRARLGPSPSRPRAQLLWGQAALEIKNCPVKWRISELSPEEKEFGLSNLK